MSPSSVVSSQLRWSVGMCAGEPEFDFWNQYVLHLMSHIRKRDNFVKRLYRMNKFLKKHGVAGSYLEHVGWSSKFRNEVFRLMIPGYGEKYFIFVLHEYISSSEPGFLSFVEPTVVSK